MTARRDLGPTRVSIPLLSKPGRCAEVDPEIFFPDRGESGREAKLVCKGCEVRQECLEFAMRNREKFGVWGGLSENERRTNRWRWRLGEMAS